MVTPSSGSREMLNGFTMIDPGARIPKHFHNCEESVLVVEGEAVAWIDGVETALKAGDTTWVAADVPHFFRNPSADAPLRIFWTYASIDATRTLVDSGQTAPIAAEHAADRLVKK